MTAQTKISAPATVALPRLRQALRLMGMVVYRRNTIPILSNVAIKNTRHEMTLRVTNLDQLLVTTLPSSGEPFETTVSLHPFAAFIATCAGDTVDLSYVAGDRARLHVECGDAIAKLSTLPFDDFPVHAAETFQFKGALGFEPKTLAAEIDYVRPAVSTEETRYYLNGIFMHAVRDEIRFVATDGHRLHLSRVEGVERHGSGALPDTIVPREAIRVIRELVRVCPGANDANLSLHPSKLRFRIGDYTLYSKAIDGTFPDYSRVIPDAVEVPTFAADARNLIVALDQATSIATEKTRAVKVTAGTRAGISLNVHSPENGECIAVVRGSEAPGLKFEIGFNAGYMREIASRLSPSTIRFEAADPAAPTRITSPEVKTRLAVLMPMRV